MEQAHTVGGGYDFEQRVLPVDSSSRASLPGDLPSVGGFERDPTCGDVCVNMRGNEFDQQILWK